MKQNVHFLDFVQLDFQESARLSDLVLAEHQALIQLELVDTPRTL